MDCFSEKKKKVSFLGIPPSKVEKNRLSRLWSTVVAGGRSNSKNEKLDAYSQSVARDHSQFNSQSF
jgi:hypothetical protein